MLYGTCKSWAASLWQAFLHDQQAVPVQPKLDKQLREPVDPDCTYRVSPVTPLAILLGANTMLYGNRSTEEHPISLSSLPAH